MSQSFAYLVFLFLTEISYFPIACNFWCGLTFLDATCARHWGGEKYDIQWNQIYHDGVRYNGRPETSHAFIRCVFVSVCLGEYESRIKNLCWTLLTAYFIFISFFCFGMFSHYLTSSFSLYVSRYSYRFTYSPDILYSTISSQFFFPSYSLRIISYH